MPAKPHNSAMRPANSNLALPPTSELAKCPTARTKRRAVTFSGIRSASMSRLFARSQKPTILSEQDEIERSHSSCSNSLFCRMILSEKSATFRDHALEPAAGDAGPAQAVHDRLAAPHDVPEHAGSVV